MDLLPLTNLDVPTEGIELLLRVASVNYSPLMVPLILKNLPDKYDLKRLPARFSDVLQSIDPKLVLVIMCNKMIIQDMRTDKLIHTFDIIPPATNMYMSSMCYSLTTSSIAWLTNTCELSILNIADKFSIRKPYIQPIIRKPCIQPINSYLSCIDYSPNGRYIAIYFYDFYVGNWFTLGNRIQIIDTTDCISIRSIDFTDACKIYFSSDSQYLFVITYNYETIFGKLYSINCIDSKQDTVFAIDNLDNLTYNEDCWCNNKDNSLHAYGPNTNDLIVRDSKSETILDHDVSSYYPIKCICFSPNNKQIAFIRNNLYIIDINTKHKKIIPLI